MEAALWKTVTTLVPKHNPRDEDYCYSQRTIVLTALWAILHDRPFIWACDPAHWPRRGRPRRLPTQSTLSRRLRQRNLRGVIRSVFQRLRTQFGSIGREAFLDGCPLRVGGASKDRQARRGRAVGGFAKGYKLHALASREGLILDFRVRALNRSEVPVARQIVTKTPDLPQRVVGDKEYDASQLHELCEARGSRLYVAPREGRVGRRQQPGRVRALRTLRTQAGQRLLRLRDTIERTFARLKSIGFGLKELPAWSRGLRRVTAWVTGKILLYNVYLLMLRKASHA